MLTHLAARCRCVWFLLFCLILSGCGGSPPPSESHAGRMVYVDVATMQPFVHDVATSFPAVHPQTGKPTLRPALYCPTCKQWSPAPDVDQVNRIPEAGLCPRDKSPLTAEGPWPDDLAAMPRSGK